MLNNIIFCIKRKHWNVVSALTRLAPPSIWDSLLEAIVSPPGSTQILFLAARAGCTSYLKELIDRLEDIDPQLSLQTALYMTYDTPSPSSYHKLTKLLMKLDCPPEICLIAARQAQDNALVQTVNNQIAAMARKEVQQKLDNWRAIHKLSLEGRLSAILIAFQKSDRQGLLLCEASLPGKRWERLHHDGVCEALALAGSEFLGGNISSTMRYAGIAARRRLTDEVVRAVAIFLSDSRVQQACARELVECCQRLSEGKFEDCSLFHPVNCSPELPHVFTSLFKLGPIEKAGIRIEKDILSHLSSSDDEADAGALIDAALNFLDLCTSMEHLGYILGCCLSSLTHMIRALSQAKTLGEENARWRASVELATTLIGLCLEMAPAIRLRYTRRAVSLLLNAHSGLKYRNVVCSGNDGELLGQALGMAVYAAYGLDSTWATSDPLVMDSLYTLIADIRLHSAVLRELYEQSDTFRSRASIAYTIFFGEKRNWYYDPEDVSSELPVLDHDPLPLVSRDDTSAPDFESLFDAAEVRIIRAQFSFDSGEFADALRTSHGVLTLLNQIPLSEDFEELRHRLKIQTRLLACKACFHLEAWALLETHAKILASSETKQKPVADEYITICGLWLRDKMPLGKPSAAVLTQVERWKTMRPLAANERLAMANWRYRAMQELLVEQNFTWTEVRNLVHWKAISRDSEGWQLPTKSSLVGMELSAIHRFHLDSDTGDLTVDCQKQGPPLLRYSDISEVFREGLISTAFTLDPVVSPELMPLHPFHEAKIIPSRVGGDILATLLDTDWLLKFLSLGMEVSANPPFLLRPVEEGLVQRLPTHLRHAIRPVHARRQGSGSPHTRYHRFWIEAGSLDFIQTQNNSKISVTFGKQEMKVRSQRMMLVDGNLVDDVMEGADSADAEFANDMTKHYDELAAYFPSLERLRELSKLLAMHKIVYGLMKGRLDAIDTMHGSVRSSVETMQREIIKDLPSFPIATEREVDRLLNETLRANNVSSSQVASSELSRVRQEIRSNLNQAEQQVISALATALNKQLDGACSQSLVQSAAQHLLSYRTVYSAYTEFAVTHLVNQARNSVAQSLKAMKSSFGFTLESVDKMLTEMDDGFSPTKICSWVPAAYFRSPGYMVYGGVSLQAQLREALNIAQPPSTSSYRMSTATLNAQRSLGNPDSDAVRIDNFNASNLRAANAQREANRRQALLNDPNRHITRVANRVQRSGIVNREASVIAQALDPKAPRNLSGWVKNQLRHIEQDRRPEARQNVRQAKASGIQASLIREVRNPDTGRIGNTQNFSHQQENAHFRGFENHKHFDHRHAKLNDTGLHRIQHRYDRGIPPDSDYERPIPGGKNKKAVPGTPYYEYHTNSANQRIQRLFDYK